MATAKSKAAAATTTGAATAPVAVAPAEPQSSADQAAAPSAPAQEQQPAAELQEPSQEFPCTVIVTNHSSFTLPEPVSGTFIAASAATRIVLHSPEHAEAVAESIHSNALAIGLDVTSLSVERSK